MRRLLNLGWCAALLAAMLATAGPLAAQTSTRDKHLERMRAKSAFNLGASVDFTLNVNNWLCGIDNGGAICTNTFGSTTGGGGFWPLGTGNQYVFQAGLQIAARSPVNPNGYVAAHCFNVSATNAACKPLTDIYHSDNPADLDAWPGECYLWNPQTGEHVKTLSQLDTCVKYWDGDPAATVPGGHPMGIEVTQHTLAFTLEGFRDMIFYIFKLKNISHAPLFRDANPSLNVPVNGWTLEDVYLAFGHDADVSGDEYDENFGTFVPFLNPETPLWLATIWQSDFVAHDFSPYPQCGFCSNPGFVGTTFLRSPYNNTGQVVRNLAAGRDVPPIDKERLEDLRLKAARGDTEAQDTLKNYEIGQSFGSLTTRGGVFPDPADAAQSWRYYSGNLNDAERSQVATSPPGFGFVDQPFPADTRYFHATGPFNLEPGDSVEVIVGLVAGAPVLDVPGFTPGVQVDHGLPGDTTRMIERIMGRGRTHTAYPSLFKQVLDARTLFETNFLLPSPPPSPTVTAIPGDRQISLTWSDEAVNFRDPYKPIADQRGIPNFREQDFEGYRVYRKVRPEAAWELIAQFDQKNGLTEVVVVTDSVLSADGEYIPIRADTALAGGDTGLMFSLVDRGGRFPDPSQGPGLLNGVRYYYTVTAYDINTPFAPGGSSLESGQRLSANLQDIGGAAALPRSLASNLSRGTFTVKMLGGDDSELDPNAPLPALDPETGRFAGPMPPTNGFVTAVQPFIPELVTQPGDLTVTIDSVVPGNPRAGVPVKYYITADAPAGSGQHVVDIPVSYFDDHDSNPVTVGFDAVRADQQFGNAFKVDPSGIKMGGTATLDAPDAWFGTAIGRAIVNGATSAWNGPRWFVSGQDEPAHPNAGLGEWWCGNDPGCAVPGGLTAGSIPGHEVVLLQGYTTTTSRIRNLEGTLATVRRAADIEVTWGEGGRPSSVYDLTHRVEVPFHTDFRASYGFLNGSSFAGVDAALTFDGDNDVITPSDFECVAPQNEFTLAGTVEFANCTSPASAKLEDAAKLSMISWEQGYFGETDAARQGFAMYINGHLFFFFGPLPAAGSKWVLRTYSGYIDAESVTQDDVMAGVTNYTFAHPAVRPPAVPGLRAEVAMAPTALNVTARRLDDVHTVPDPFLVSSPLQTTPADRKLLFVNLPDQATIRIYSLSGVLIDAIEHSDPSGGGTAQWGLRNRNNQYVASGVYFYHVETPDGKSKVGKFTVIQAP